MVKPFIIGTYHTKNILQLGVEILRDGGSAIDAVEETIRAAEENPLIITVGVGGIPNLLGVTQLDASIMDGKTLRTGAVAALEKYPHPISIARKVLEVSPHDLLVGPGAALFAEAMGFEQAELLIDRSRNIYKAFLEDALGELDERDFRTSLVDSVRLLKLKEWYNKLSDVYYGTVNVLAIDGSGDICSGVSTSGSALKLPGRVGDSPIIGAGNYCDNRVGAAACMGKGELAMRLCTARTIISYMENGMTLHDACVRSMRDVLALKEAGTMTCLALDKSGNTMSASTGREPIYYYMEIDLKEPEMRQGIEVKL